MQDRITLAQAVTTYLGSLGPEVREQSQQELRRFLRWFGGERVLARLSAPEVASYAEGVATGGGDPQRLEPVRAFLAYAKREEFTAANLSVHLRLKKPTKTATVARGRQHQTVRLTEAGQAGLQAELERLRAERPRLAAELRRAAADKDFRENAPLDAARERQGHIEARIRELESLLSVASVAKPTDRTKADLGCALTLYNLTSPEEVSYTLVHPREVNLAQGKISVASPLGKALLGRQEGDTVEVVAPAGIQRYQIRSITH